MTQEELGALVTDNLALVGHLAREAAARMPRHLDIEDLMGAGALALVQAAHSFDPSRGVPFNRFASVRVRGAMIDQMRQRDWATRSVRSRARHIAETTEQLTAALHRLPTEDEVSAATGLTVEELRAVSAGADRASLMSLDPVREDGSSLGELVVDPDPRPDEALVVAERMSYLRNAVAELPERLRSVVVGYYLENRQLTDLATELGVTQSRASQLRAEGLSLLHQALSTLLEEENSASCAHNGARERRRDAYVRAVATRSSPAAQPDVRATGLRFEPTATFARPARTGRSEKLRTHR